MISKNTMALSLAVAGIIASASSSYAGLALDLRSATGDAKSVTVAHVGDVVTLNIYATVTGSNGSITDDGLQSAYFSALSTLTGNGAAIGNFSILSASSPFNATVQGGTQIDLNGQPGTDLGSTSTTTAGTLDFAYLRSSSMTLATSSNEFLIGSLTWTVTALPDNGTTTLNLLSRNINIGALWREDGANKSPTTSAYSIGQGVVVNVASAPEPASVAILGLSGMGLLLRRRR